MWPVSDGVNSLIINTDTKRLHWYDQMGCICMDDDNSIEQSIAEFRERGAPGLITAVPNDVMAEIQETITTLAAALDPLGGGQTLFSATLKGNTQPLYATITSQPWVDQVELVYQNGVTQWQIEVADETAAEQHLFRLLPPSASADGLPMSHDDVLELGRQIFF
ncbi:MAG: hypothetical protein R6X32_04280, partial [Chloroflexota bacterium]